MNTLNRFKLFSFVLVVAYLLSACGGVALQSEAAAPAPGPKVGANIVAFTGTVEDISGSQWTVGGQPFTLDAQALLDPNIAVGDEVKVEANVLEDGAVVAMKVESTKADDIVSTPSADSVASSTPDPVATSSPDAGSTPDASSSPDAPTPQAGVNENEVFGTVEALTATTITVNGVTYNLTNSTEFKDALAVGDTIKLHVTFNADGTVTVREVEKSDASFDDNGASGNSDDGPTHDANDDHGNDDDSDDSNDDHGGNSGPGGGHD